MSGPARGHEQFDVEADVGVRAWGATRADAFAEAALGVFALIVPPADVHERDIREVRAQGETPEGLLVSWINECLYVHDIEGFVVHRVEVLAVTDTLIHARLYGEEVDPNRHRLGTVVKAATYHQVSLEEGPAGAHVRLIVDV